MNTAWLIAIDGSIPSLNAVRGQRKACLSRSASFSPHPDRRGAPTIVKFAKDKGYSLIIMGRMGLAP